MPIYDLGTGSIGILRDISEKGLRVAGIDARVGQARTFQIPIDLFMQADPLLILAECKWAKPTGKIKEYVVAGFEILDLTAKAGTRSKTSSVSCCLVTRVIGKRSAAQKMPTT